VINLELKARDADPAATEAACAALGARDAGTLVQRDTYFEVAHGKLKLREHLSGEAGAELIAYDRPDGDGVRVSTYERVAVDDPAALRSALSTALGVLGVVEKTRRLYLYRHVRIHLDEIAYLGSFVELEAVQPPHARRPPGRDEALGEAIAALGLRGAEPVTAGYLELVLEVAPAQHEAER
jgi:adenylate cyclase class IV